CGHQPRTAVTDDVTVVWHRQEPIGSPGTSRLYRKASPVASHNRGANPAAPTLPGTLTTTTVDAELLDDEAQWWQLDLNGGADPGTAAANFTVEQCRLSHVDLSQGRWRAAEWRDCVIAHANLANIHAQRCHWQRVSVADARATGLAWTDGVV